MSSDSEHSNRLRAMVLPKGKDSSSPGQLTLVNMVHPRTRISTRFLKGPDGSVYELKAITGARRKHIPGQPRSLDVASQKAHSLLVEHADTVEKRKQLLPDEHRPGGESESTNDSDAQEAEPLSYFLSDSSITVCTPVSPLFFVLNVLYKARSQSLQPDVIYEMIETETSEVDPTAKPIEFESFKKAAYSFCEPLIKNMDPEVPNQLSDNNLYKLSIPLLFQHFDKVVQRICNGGISPEIRRRIIEAPLLPPFDVYNEEASPDPEMMKIATERAASHLLCTYVPPELTKEYLSTKKEQFDKLDSHIAEVAYKRTAAVAQQNTLTRVGDQDSEPTSTGNSHKRKLGSSSSSGPSKKQAAPTTRSRASKALAKVNKTGIKSLNSFFKPKTK